MWSGLVVLDGEVGDVVGEVEDGVVFVAVEPFVFQCLEPSFDHAVGVGRFHSGSDMGEV